MSNPSVKNNIVVYTALFGSRDELIDPTYVPEGVDFVCFSDRDHQSTHWEVRRVSAPFPDDLTRSNRYFKIMVHEVLPEYEYSIYIDGNVFVTSDITKLIDTYLATTNFAALDCALYSTLPSDSVAQQVDRLLQPGQDKRNNESYENIKAQWAAYQAEGFPDNTGCIMGMLLVRRHLESDVQAAMTAWWREVTTRSKRDLMSFNYVAWKQQFAFTYIPLDGADNEYVKKVRHTQPLNPSLRYRLRQVYHRLFG